MSHHAVACLALTGSWKTSRATKSIATIRQADNRFALANIFYNLLIFAKCSDGAVRRTIRWASERHAPRAANAAHHKPRDAPGDALGKNSRRQNSLPLHTNKGMRSYRVTPKYPPGGSFGAEGSQIPHAQSRSFLPQIGLHAATPVHRRHGASPPRWTGNHCYNRIALTLVDDVSKPASYPAPGTRLIGPN